MSAGSLGSAQGEILINVEQAIANLEKLAAALKNTDGAGAGIGQGISQQGSKLDQLGAKADSLNQKYGQLGKVGLGVGALVAGGFGVAINTAANFEASMDGVGASLGGVGTETGITTEQFQKLNEEALKIGANTSASAGEVAGVMDSLAKAGISVEEIYGGVAEGVVNVSEATGESLGQTADSFGALTNLFRDTGISSSQMADVIVNGMNNSNASLSEFQTGIARMAPVIAGTGMSFEDSAAAIAYFNSQGFSAAEVGTSLTAAYNNLVNPTKEQAAAQKEMGIAAFDAQGKFVGFPALMDQVQAATAGMTDEQRAATLATLFGADAMDLMTLASKNGGDGLAEYETRMEASGTAAAASAQRMDNLKGSIEQLKGAIESALIVVGSKLTPFIRAIADALAGMVNGFLNLPGPIQTAIAAVIGIAGALAGLAGVIVTFGPQAIAIAKQMQMLVTAFTGLLAINPIVLAIVAALALLAIAYKTNFLGFADKVNAAAGKIRSGFQSVAKAVKPFIDQFNRLRQITNPVSAGMLTLSSVFRSLAGMGGPLSGVFSTIAEGLVKGANMASQFVARFNELRGEVNIVQAFFQALGDTLTRFAGSFGPLEGAIESLGSAFQNIADGIGDVIDVFQALFEGNFGEAFEELVEAASNFGNAILDLYQVIPRALAGIGAALLDFLQGVDWGGLWDGITSAAGQLWDALTTAIGDINWASVGDYIVGAAESLATKGEEMVQGFLDALVEHFPRVLSWIGSVGQFIAVAAANANSWMIEKGAEVITGFLDALVNNFPRVLSWIGSIGQFIGAAIADAAQWLAPRAVEAITGFLDALVENFPRVLSWIGSIGTFIGAAITGAAKWLAPRAVEAITGFLDTLVEEFPRVLSWLGSIGQFVQVAVGSLIETLKDKGTDLIEGFATAVSERWDTFTEWIGDNISVSALTALIPDLAIPNPFATILGFIDDLISKAETALDALRKLQFWNSGGDAVDPNNDPRRYEPTKSNKPTNLADGTLVTTLPAVGSGPGSVLAQVQAMASQVGQAIANLATQVSAGVQRAAAGLLPLGIAFQTLSTQATSTITQMTAQVTARLTQMSAQAGASVSQMASQVQSRFSAMSSQASSTISQMASQVQARISQMSSQASSSANTMRSSVGSAMSGMASQATSAMSQFVSAVQSGFQRAVSAAQSGVNQIRGVVSGFSLVGQGQAIGAGLGQGIAAGIQGQIGAVASAAAALVSAAVTAANNAAQVASPSRLTMETGTYMAEGLALGIERGSRDVKAAMADLIPTANMSARHQFGAMAVPGSAPVMNVTVIALRSEDWVDLVQKAETGHDFAREMAFGRGGY